MSAIRPSLRGKIRGVVLRTKQGWYCLDPDEQFVSKSLIETGAYNLHEVERAAGYVGAESRVLVVGAHIGTIAIPLSKRCSELVAIEANPDTYEFLELNVRMNACGNVKVYNVAANDKNAPVTFLMNTHNSGGSKRMPKTRDHAYFYDNPKTTTVRGVLLDEFLDRHDFDLVFMDIEGSEYFALCGMQKILSHAKTLIVEFLPHHLTRVAGITLEDFLRPIRGNFDSLHVPSTGARVGRSQFFEVLKKMFEDNRGDAGLVFRKNGGA